MRVRLLAAVLALAALWPLALLGASAADAAPRGTTRGGWSLAWDTASTAPSLAGHVSYLGSNRNVVATINLTSTLPASCLSTTSFTVRHGDGTGGTLSPKGDFSQVDPGVRCNGPYTATLSGYDAQLLLESLRHSPTLSLPFTYTHPSAGVAAPTVNSGADGSSLVVSWKPPANATPDLVGYRVTRTYKPADGGAPQVKTFDVDDPATLLHTDAVGTNYGGYQYTVQARYWGAAGPGSSELVSAASAPVQATVSAPAQGGDPPGTTVTTSSGGGAGDGGGGGGGGGGGSKPVIDTTPGAAKNFFPIPNVPHTESPHVATPTVPSVPGMSSGTTEVPQDGQYAIPEPGGPEAVKPKTPLSATTTVDHPTGGGINGRTIAVVAASVLVLGLVAAQLTFLSRRAAALELPTEDEEIAGG